MASNPITAYELSSKFRKRNRRHNGGREERNTRTGTEGKIDKEPTVEPSSGRTSGTRVDEARGGKTATTKYNAKTVLAAYDRQLKLRTIGSRLRIGHVVVDSRLITVFYRCLSLFSSWWLVLVTVTSVSSLKQAKGCRNFTLDCTRDMGKGRGRRKARLNETPLFYPSARN